MVQKLSEIIIRVLIFFFQHEKYYNSSIKANGKSELFFKHTQIFQYPIGALNMRWNHYKHSNFHLALYSVHRIRLIAKTKVNRMVHQNEFQAIVNLSTVLTINSSMTIKLSVDQFVQNFVCHVLNFITIQLFENPFQNCSSWLVKLCKSEKLFIPKFKIISRG